MIVKNEYSILEPLIGLNVFKSMNNFALQKDCVEKILNSQEFANSSIYKSYVTYLVEAAAEGKELKESTIAIEFFGKDASFNPAEDTIVRSHTYKLRKKLEMYYLKEGKEDKYRLRIPKGHYEVTFVPVAENKFTSEDILEYLKQNKILLIIVAALCFGIAYLWIHDQNLENRLNRYAIVDKADPIWKDYLQSELPILIAVGDHFFFNEYTDSYENLLAIRDGKINSIEDLRDFNARHPDRKIQPADEPYFPYHSIWSLPPVLSLLYSVNAKPILRKSSALSPQMLNEYNIIFVGSIKTLYTMKHIILTNSHFRFEISPHRIEFIPPDTTSAQTFKTSLHSAGPNEDLVLALKLPGPANNSIFIIASYHSLGAPEIANYLTNPETRKELEKKFQEKFNKIPQYFELLFRVTGIDKTAYNTELLIFNEIVKNN